MSDLETSPPELEDLAKEVGDFISYWGFKHVHGRLWTHLYLSETPLDAAQLRQKLGVSKALISLTLSDLMRFNVILEIEKSAHGTQLYVANPDVLDVILNVLRRRERKMLAQAETTHRLLGLLGPEKLKRSGLEPGRVQSLGEMIQNAQNTLASILELTSMDMTSWEDFNPGKRVE